MVKLMSYVNDAYHCVSEIIKRVGRKLVVATPLGLGKPVQILNALYKEAKRDPSVDLTIISGLSFLKPEFQDQLANRLLGPALTRIYNDYEDLLYEVDRRKELVPQNIKIIEFFFV